MKVREVKKRLRFLQMGFKFFHAKGMKGLLSLDTYILLEISQTEFPTSTGKDIQDRRKGDACQGPRSGPNKLVYRKMYCATTTARLKMTELERTQHFWRGTSVQKPAGVARQFLRHL